MESDALRVALQRDDGDWAREHLAADVVGWLTTVAADGTPQSSIISFLWDADTVFFYSKPDTPKLRNIARSPLVSFHLQSDPYGDRALIVEGTAAEDRSIPPRTSTRPTGPSTANRSRTGRWARHRRRPTSRCRSGSRRGGFASARNARRAGSGEPILRRLSDASKNSWHTVCSDKRHSDGGRDEPGARPPPRRP